MWRSPSRSPEIRDDWTSCTAFCARAWQRPQCVTSVALRAKWKLRFAPCGSIGVQPPRATLAETHAKVVTENPPASQKIPPDDNAVFNRIMRNGKRLGDCQIKNCIC